MDSIGWYQPSTVPRFEAGLFWPVYRIATQPGVYLTGPDVSWTTKGKSHLRVSCFVLIVKEEYETTCESSVFTNNALTVLHLDY